MSITSLYFVVFIIILIPLYYIIPKRAQWLLLLAASVVFYMFAGVFDLIYPLLITLVSWTCALRIQSVYDSGKQLIASSKGALDREYAKKIKLKAKKRARRILLIGALAVVALLLSVKVLHLILGGRLPYCDRFLTPLGISYFSLQAIGYVTDVYGNGAKAEKNYLKVLLFIIFFPQVTQGPINEWTSLSGSLFSEHRLDYENYTYGLQRMLWGFFKKMVIADTIAPYVDTLAANYSGYSSIALFVGMPIFMIRLYADFSGYMDIMCGLCTMLGLHLTENFNCPFFSKSLTEFWTRWHISLGAWFKKHVFYPVGMNEHSMRIYKKINGKAGRFAADCFLTSISTFSVWILIGLWHGLSPAFLVWGILNGMIMIMSAWLQPVYYRAKKALRIDSDSKLWIGFQIIRTFLLVCTLEVLTDVGDLSVGIDYLRCLLTNGGIPGSFSELFPYVSLVDASALHSMIIAISGLMLMFAISVINQKTNIKALYSQLPMIIKIAIVVSLFFIISTFGVESTVNNSGGFLYAQY